MPSNLSKKRRIWRLVLPIALIMVVLGITVGEAGHHHASFSTSTCPICHVTHQAIEPPVANASVTVLVPNGPGPEPEHYSFIPSRGTRHIAARAPPVS